MTRYTIDDQDIFTAAIRTEAKHFTKHISYQFVFGKAIKLGDITPAKRNSQGEWQPIGSGFIPEDDFFRIEEDEGKICLSLIASEDCSFAFVGRNNHSIPAHFQGICRYFDNRKATVIVSADDWDDQPHNHSACLAAVQACQKRQLWITVAIVTGKLSKTQWEQITGSFNQGYVEISSHSTSHFGKQSYGIALSQELAGSRNTLLSYMPDSNVRCWIEPSGYLDPEIANNLADAGYLVSRSTQQNRRGFCAYTSYGCFLRAGITTMLEESNLDRTNRLFDTCHKRGGIYHAAMHPRALDWSNTGWIQRHLDVISGHRDIWYAGLGDVYCYRYLSTQALTLKQGKRLLHAPSPRWKIEVATMLINVRMLLDRLMILVFYRNRPYQSSL